MYPKQVTEKIVEYWALGFSAEETRKALQENQSVTIALNTIYKHRHSLTAQHLIDELIRRQERAILKADTENPSLAMKYRDKLLEKLMPQKIQAEQNVSVSLPGMEFEFDPAIRNLLLKVKGEQKQEHDTTANPAT